MARRDWLVGREHARTVLAEALEAARSGAGGLVLVSGEPGIGKSAMLTWAAERAEPELQVLRGLCWDSASAPPYWLWTQVLRGSGLAPGDLGAAAMLLEPIDVHGSLAAGDRPAAAEARFRLFDAVTRGLQGLAARRPVLVVLDDLHWADDASVELLSLVARAVVGDPVLLVGAYRDGEALPVLRALAAKAIEVPLTGLSSAEATALVAALPGRPLSSEVTDDLWQRSAGNPLFVQELARLVQAEASGRPVGHLPAGVVEAVRQRLARLPTDAVGLLDWAAVAGRDIEVPLLVSAGAAPDQPTAEVWLDLARQVGVVTEGDPPAWAHDLYRQAIAEAQPIVLNARINRALGRATQARGRPGDAARIAAHLLRGGLVVKDEAVDWCVRAAREATARLGHEDACRNYQAALALTDPVDPRRLPVLIELSAALARTGGIEAARQHYREAAELSQRRGDAARTAEVALGLQALGQRTDPQFAEALDLLRRAGCLLEERGGGLALRSRVAAATAVCLRHSRYGTARPEVREAAERAVALAEESGDPSVRAAARLALHDAIWVPGTAGERLVVAEEMLGAAEHASSADLVAQAHLLRATALLELGEPEGREALLAYVRAAERLGHPRGRWSALTRQATYAQIAGRAEEAAALGEKALHLGRTIGEPDALGVFLTHRFALVALGVSARSEELDVSDPMWTLRPLVAAWPHAARGDPAAAAAVLGDFSVLDIPVSTSLEAPAVAAVVFAAVGTEQQRHWVYDLLLPFAGTHVVVGGCASYHGAVDHHLGVLAAVLGDRAAARAHLDAALTMHQRLGAAGWSRLSAEELAEIAVPGPEFRRADDGWILGYDGCQVRVRDAKGLHDLWQILGARGAEVHVLTLLGVPDRRMALGADPVLDGRAKAEYKARLAQLGRALEDAEYSGAGLRTEQLRAERSAIVHELAVATGLGGRDRRLGAESERARKTVGARVRDSLDRIERVHPGLAAHLRVSVRLGTTCAYRPLVSTEWRLT